MAWAFDGTTTNLIRSDPIVSALPITLACWFRLRGGSTQQFMMGSGSTSSAYPMAVLAYRPDLGGGLRANYRDNVGVDTTTLTTSTAVVPGRWHHGAAVFTSTTSRSMFLDGGGAATDTTSVPNAWTVDSFAVGSRYTTTGSTLYFNGLIAHAAIWAAALTPAEIRQLAAGARPDRVRPGSLAEYWTAGRNSGVRGARGTLLLPSGSVGWAEGPPVMEPRKRVWGPASSPSLPSLSFNPAWTSRSRTIGVGVY